MKIMDMFFDMYERNKSNPQIKSVPGTLKHCQVACKYLCGGITRNGLKKNGITQSDIQEAVNAKLIEYQPCMGYLMRETGYTLTAAGVREVYKKSKESAQSSVNQNNQ
jgi:hypothetical protein